MSALDALARSINITLVQVSHAFVTAGTECCHCCHRLSRLSQSVTAVIRYHSSTVPCGWPVDARRRGGGGGGGGRGPLVLGAWGQRRRCKFIRKAPKYFFQKSGPRFTDWVQGRRGNIHPTGRGRISSPRSTALFPCSNSYGMVACTGMMAHAPPR